MIVLTGGYTNKKGNEIEGGIYTFEFDEKEGTLTQKDLYPTVNPSYICVSDDNKFLYTFEEIGIDEKPKLKAFSLDKAGKLTFLNETVIPGGAPCHIRFSKDKKFLLIACYSTGNVFAFAIKTDGTVGDMTSYAQHSGSSINKSRQEGPHAHMVALDKEGKVYVCDLGLDKIKVYSLSPAGELSPLDEDIKIAEGSGPRHMVFHPDGEHAFVINELTSTVSLLKKEGGKFKVLKDYLALDGSFSGLPTAAAIRISKKGKFVYSTDRTIQAISIFEFDADNSTLKLLTHEETGGEAPRDFNIAPSGKWIIAANQNTDNIVTFSRDKKTGLLSRKSEITDIVKPTSIVFVK
ncbi:MAG: hypothetical protein CMO01_09900 [Thalassobius sp.]|nr:hypothetical protein [Thalassovita sp.]